MTAADAYSQFQSQVEMNALFQKFKAPPAPAAIPKPKTVRPLRGYVSASPIALMFGKKPKCDWTCGHCSASWSGTVPHRVDHPGLVCDSCGVVNIIPIKWTKE